MKHFGVHEEATTGGRTLERAKIAFPYSNLSRAFVPNLVRSDFVKKVEAALRPHIRMGGEDHKVYLSLKTDQTLTARGGYVNAYGNVAKYLCKEGLCHRVSVIPWHEPEDNFVGTLYQRYFYNVRTAMKNKCPDVQVGTATNSYHWDTKWNNKNVSVAGKTDNPLDWWVEADFKGIDIYSGRTWKLNKILPELNAFNRWHEHNVGDEPYQVNERGFATPSKNEPFEQYELRAATILREFEWLKNDRIGQKCEDYLFWNSSGRERDESLVLDPLGEEALREGINMLVEDSIADDTITEQ